MHHGGVMNIFKISFVFLLSLFCLPSFAAEPSALKEGSSNLSFSLYSGGEYSAQYRQQISNVSGVYFGLSYYTNEQNYSFYTVENESYTFLAGYRRYLSVSTLASFVDTEIHYGQTESEITSNGGFTDSSKRKEKGVGVYFGLEYFAASKLSIEARTGIVAEFSKDESGDKNKTISFPNTLLRVNYYWD